MNQEITRNIQMILSAVILNANIALGHTGVGYDKPNDAKVQEWCALIKRNIEHIEKELRDAGLLVEK